MKPLKYLLHAAVLIGLVVAGMKYINGDLFWRAIHQFNWWYVPLILVCSRVYFAVRALRFAYLLARVDGADLKTVLRAYMAGQSCAMLPAGAAFRAVLLSEAGVPVSHSAPVLALSSLADGLSLLLSGLVCALWFDAARKATLVFLTGLIAVCVLLGIQAARSWVVGRIGRIMDRLNLLRKWREALVSTRDLLCWQAVGVTTGLTVISVALMVLALHFALDGVGAAVELSTVLFAFSLPALMGRASALPGGIGVTEAGMVGILDSAPGVTIDQAAAAVVIFRAGTVLFEALLGAAIYLLAWRGRTGDAVAREFCGPIREQA
jgi:uncharacterized protein (TIRG00374 family)